VFEDRWRKRLRTLHGPEEVEVLFKRHGAGDCFQRTYASGEWLACVSAASCGNGMLPDLLLIRERDGTLHRIDDEHCCGRGGILHAIPQLATGSYEDALAAIRAIEHRRSPRADSQ
jgi:hypothetical protein